MKIENTAQIKMVKAMVPPLENATMVKGTPDGKIVLTVWKDAVPVACELAPHAALSLAMRLLHVLPSDWDEQLHEFVSATVARRGRLFWSE